MMNHIEEDHIAYQEQSVNDTGPLILDEVVVPVEERMYEYHMTQMVRTDCSLLVKEAREERDKALELAQNFRNIAEQSRREKRELQYDLEAKVEIVRDFWRNEIVKGGLDLGKF